MNGVEITYGDIAVEAKENFVPTASESEFGEQYKAQLMQYNLNFPNYANPCELYQTVLDGTASAFPSVPEQANLGLWSEQISNDDGTFTEPIVLSLESNEQYTSQGLTLKFDIDNSIYPTRLNIQWLRVIDGQTTDLGNVDFFPGSASYFCQNLVENYTKVVITFYSLNMPLNRLKLRSIDYGVGVTFFGNELRSVKLIQEIDPISSQISINTADFTIDSKSGLTYTFQEKQPITISFNGVTQTTAFVKSSKRKGESLWEIRAEDYIGLLDSIPYYGGVYSNEKAIDIIRDIFKVANIPFVYSLSPDITVTGYIPYTTCRNALMQVAFAIQGVVDTSGTTQVKIFSLDNGIKQTVSLDRIMQGQNFQNSSVVTGVEVAVHSYKPITETMDVYDANESGTGQDIFVKFSEPLHDLSITNGSFAVDKEGNELKHTNYAVINADSGCILRGKKYEHGVQIRRKNNPLVLATNVENIVAVESATLVSSSNIDNVLEKCYNWLTRTQTTNLKIVERKHIKYGEHIRYGNEQYGYVFKYGDKYSNIITYDKSVSVGDNISAETQYLGIVNGTVTKQTYNLNGNILVKEVVMK